MAARIVMTLMLEPGHWRRHDRAHWAQVLAAAIDDAAPGVMRVESYELGETVLLVRCGTNRTSKEMQKLLQADDAFLRLRARLFDLGASAEFEVEKVAG